jgi:pimeloyl-ACP methyl ester carboxylesterase
MKHSALFALICLGAITMAHAQRAAVDGGQLEYEISRSTGEPVLLIHGTGIAAAHLPLMSQTALSEYRLVRYHRRGFAGSSPVPKPFGMKEQAADAVALLRSLQIERAHVVGASFGGLIALQMALDFPAHVHSLVLLEPPIPVPGAGPPAHVLRAMELYRAGDTTGALDTMFNTVMSSDWRSIVERSVPGGLRQLERDVATTFESDGAAVTKWSFGEEQARRIRQPMLFVRGAQGMPIYVERRRLLKSWAPQTEDVTLPGLNHALQMQDPKAVAEAIAAFLKRHPF